jgi:enhancer of mRNA-decapping protein 3
MPPAARSQQSQNPPPLQSQGSAQQQPVFPPPDATRPAFVDPAIVSMGRKAVSQTHPQATAIPQEAPATPIKPTNSAAATAAAAAPFPKDTQPFVGNVAKERNIRKPSAATLEGPFSSLDIADAQELDSDDVQRQNVRRASVTKTRTGKPMEDPNIQSKRTENARFEEGWKRTRRGGKARKREVTAHEKRNGDGLASSPEAVRKG